MYDTENLRIILKYYVSYRNITYYITYHNEILRIMLKYYVL